MRRVQPHHGLFAGATLALAAAAPLLGAPYPYDEFLPERPRPRPKRRPPHTDYTAWRESPKPLTKRQQRRLRGKGSA